MARILRKKRVLLMAAAVVACLGAAAGWWWHHITTPEYRTRYAVEKIRAALVDPNSTRGNPYVSRSQWLAGAGDPKEDLQRLGARAVPFLIEVVRSKDPYTCAAGMRGLRAAARGEGDVEPLLVRALKEDADAEVRRAAAEALTSREAIDFDSIEALAEALEDEDRRVGNSAMDALVHHYNCGPADAILRLILQRARSARPAARWNAAWLLAVVCADVRIAVPELIRLLTDPHRIVRQMAAIALGHIGPMASAAEGALRRAAKDENSYVREAAVEALKQIRGRPTSAAATTRSDERQ